MGSPNLTNDEITMRYPQRIIDWEMKHGIARYERNGMLYVCCVKPFEDVCESIRKENEQKEATKRNRYMEVNKNGNQL